MFILARILMSLAFLLDMICSVLYFLIVIRIVISWFRVDPYHEIVQMIYKITDPILAPFRRLPLQIGMIDLSPILAFITISVGNYLIGGLLRDIAARL